MARGATAAGELRRAINAFLQEAGDDKRYAAVVERARGLESALNEAGSGDSNAPTPGQRAAGAGSDQGGRDRGTTPGQAAASNASPKDRAREKFGGSASSAKGADHNLPPFLQRQKMKRGATARKGS